MSIVGYSNELLYILRIIIAGICGIVIGFERKNRLKEAGIRTHCLVACGAALMMVLSKYSFYDVISETNGLKIADPARVAAQVVSGVGFLGAGMIFVHKNTVTGLTTAAGIWTTAGIGMAIGAGMYMTGVAVTVIVFVIQTIFHLNVKWMKAPHSKVLKIFNVDEPGYERLLTGVFKEKGITIHDTVIRKGGGDGFKTYKLSIETPPVMDDDEIISLIDYESEISAVH